MKKAEIIAAVRERVLGFPCQSGVIAMLETVLPEDPDLDMEVIEEARRVLVGKKARFQAMGGSGRFAPGSPADYLGQVLGVINRRGLGPAQ